MKIKIILLGLFLTFSVFSQENIKTKLIDSLEIKADTYIGKDNLKTDYYLAKNVLKKRTITKDFHYQNLSFGKIKLSLFLSCSRFFIASLKANLTIPVMCSIVFIITYKLYTNKLKILIGCLIN